MLDRLRNTVKHTTIYGFGKLGTKIIGLILLPLYTDYLTPDEYGMLSLLEATSQIMIGVLGFRLSMAMMRWLATEKDENRKKTITSTTYISTFASVVLLCLILIPLKKELSLLYFNDGKFSRYFLILIVSAGIDILNHITFDLIRLAERSLLFISIMAVKFISILGFNIYFIVALEMGVEGIILSMLIGNLLMLFISIPFILRRMNFVFDFRTFGEMFRFGFPLIFSTVSVLILSFGDRFILKYITGLSDVGIYALGYKIAGVINLLVLQSFQMGFVPVAYKMFDKPDAKRFFSRMLTYFTFVLMFSVLGISFYSREVIEWFARKPEYWYAYHIVPFIAFAFLIKGWQLVVVLGLHKVKKTTVIAVSVMVAAILNIALNFLLIPWIGIFGAATASIISTLAGMVLVFHYAQKYFPVRYEYNRIAKILLTGVMLLAVYYSINNLDLILRLALKTLLLASFPFILYMLRFYDPLEILRISSLWRTWKDPKAWGKNLKRIKNSKEEND
ncbi:MAG: oligosaccharide flippase family protein [Bacteroidales bacterium]